MILHNSVKKGRMPTSNPTDILLAQDVWATRNIIDACAKLSDAQFHQRFETGPGSLHDTLMHMITVLRVWTDVLTGREPRPRLEPAQQRSASELRTLFDETAPEFARQARANPLDELVARERNGKLYHFTRGAILTHATTHGMHHRAQCLNMLRHVGVSPLPHSSVIEWTWMGDK